MKLGIRLESLNLPFRQGLPVASRLGLHGIQADAFGELHPDQLPATARREVRNLLRSHGLELAAINCPLRRGIDAIEDQQPRLEYLRKAMDLAYDLGTRIAIVPLPKLPENPEAPTFAPLQEAIQNLGTHGDRTGVKVALEIGFDPADAVLTFLDQYKYESLALNYDPANFLLHSYDPAKNLFPLGKRLVHFQARDARTTTVSGGAAEVPLGAGDVNWMAMAGALAALEYRGFVTLKRERGRATVAEFEAGVGVLRAFVV